VVAEHTTEELNGERAADGPTKAPICTVAFCPICTAVTMLGDARPDIIEHMLLAARETLLAFQALIDVRLDGAEPKARSGRVERITIE
jgi:hypothetical protein